MTRIIRNPWTLAVAIASGVVLWMASGALRSDSEARDAGVSGAARPAPERRVAVQVREQRAERIERRLQISARTAPARQVLLKAETSGRVVATPATRGARLDAGEVMLRLDIADRQVRLRQAEAEVRARELDYEAQQALKPSGFVAEARLADALALLEAARTELERARLDLERMTIRAPFDGVLLEREAELGDYVTPGDPLVTYLDDRTLVVSGAVNEGDIGAVAVGMAADATLADGSRHRGRVRYVAPLAEASTRTFLVELAVENPQGAIPLGASAQLHLPLDTVAAHPLSPALLALDDAGDLGVKIVDRDEQVRFVNVSLARAEADTVWVTGLPDPARIITVGQGFVSDGQRVETRFESGPDGVPGVTARQGADAASPRLVDAAEQQ